MPNAPMDVTLYKQMSIPTDLAFVVAQMVEMVDAGWEPCGFQGGGSGKVQFQKVEFRRRPHDAHD